MGSVSEEELVTGMTYHSAEFHREGNVPPDDAWLELLSAYLDGEVTDEERTRVENRLEQDVAAQEALRELRQLSSALKSLPRHAPPPDLASISIPQRAQLNPGTSPRPELSITTTQEAAVSERSASGTPGLRPPRRFLRRREWLAGTMALAMTVLLMVSLRVNGPLYDEKSVASSLQGERLSMSATPSPLNVTENRVNEEALVAARPLTRGWPEMPESTTAASAPLELDRGNSLAAKEGASFINGPAMKTATSAAPAAVSDSLPLSLADETKSNSAVKQGDYGIEDGSAGGTPDQNLQQWQDVQPYLNLLAQNTGAVANVDLMVLDVHQAADQFQVLLLQNGVVVDSASSISSLPAPDFALNEKMDQGAKGRASAEENAAEAGLTKSGQAGVSLTAVYVEAKEPAVTKALEEMVRQRRVLALRLQPPLQLDAVVPAGPPLQDSLADGVAHRDVSRSLQEAYWSVLMANSGEIGAISGPVSALNQLANPPGEEAAQEVPLLIQGTQEAERFGSQMSRRNAPNGAGGAVAESGVRQNYVTGNSQELSRRAGQPGTGDANFGQRVNLSVAPENWYLQVQNAAKIPALAEANDAAFQKTLDQQRGLNGNSMRAMQRNFRRAAPGSVRVLFVLQPAPAGTKNSSAP